MGEGGPKHRRPRARSRAVVITIGFEVGRHPNSRTCGGQATRNLIDAPPQRSHSDRQRTTRVPLIRRMTQSHAATMPSNLVAMAFLAIVCLRRIRLLGLDSSDGPLDNNLQGHPVFREFMVRW